MSTNLLIDLGLNMASLQRDVVQAQKSIQGFARSTESAFRSLGTIAAMGGLSVGMGQAITAFMDAEKASMKMAVAMKNQGDYTKAAMADMQEYAATIQRTTAFEDDAVLSVMANLKTYGMMNEEVKKSTQAVLDLAGAKQAEGMTIERASELIGKAYMGETTALKRVGIVIDENIPKTEAYAKVMEQIQGRFGGAAAAELETYAGQWKQIKNQFQDVAENVGIVLLKALEGAAFGANMVAVGFYSVLEAANKLGSFLAGAVGFSGMADYGRLAAEEFGKLKDAALESADKTLKMFNSWGEGIDKAVGKMKDGTRAVRELGKAESEKIANKMAVDQFKDMVKILTEFEKESAKVGKSIGDQELIDLNIRYEYFKRFVTDEAKLEQWLADEKKSIMIRANNETIALWEELYKQTQNDKYAQAAIDAMKEILDAEENKWRVILDNDDDAHALRLKREQEYVDKIKGMIQQVAVAEQQAIITRETSAYDASYLSAPKSTEGVVGQTRINAFGEKEMWSSHGLGWVTGTSGGGLSAAAGYGASAAGEQSVDLTKVNQIFSTQINYYNDKTNEYAKQAADLAQQIADENKRVAEEYQREYDARKKTFETARGRFADYAQERERQGWGTVQYQQQFAKLAGEFESSQYFETSIDLLGQMIDVIKELDYIARDQLEQQKQQTASLKESSVSISDWLMDLSQGSMAPVQSSAMWATRFEELKAQAMNDQAKVGEFLAYAQKYLAFEKSYGTKGSYTAAYQSTVSAVSGLGDWMDLAAQLSNLGLGDSLSDIRGVIDAFAALGVGSVALKDAADAAALAMTSAATNSGTFATAAGAAAWQAESAAANTDAFASSANAVSLATMAAGLKTDGFTLATNSAASAAYDAAVKTGDYAAATNILKAAADQAAGSTLTAAAGTGALGSAVDTLKNVAGTAAGAEGMGKIITSLETTLPESAAVAGLEASGLSDALQDTETPFENIKNAMTKTVSNLDIVGQFWASLAEKLGFSMNPSNVGTALSSIQSSAYAAMPWTVSEGYWYSPTGGKKPGGPGTDWSYYGYSYVNAGSYPERPPGMAKGGLTSGLTFAGESGSEWVVPTYEPQRSSFLRDVGADPEAIGEAIAKRISGMGGGGDIHVSVQIDGREIGSVVAKQMKTNRDLRESTRGAMN